jgi:hypothetical protein
VNVKDLKFKIFGKLIAITGEAGAWRGYYFGNEGKRRPADFIVPHDVQEEELCEYLADLFHEHATPRNNTAVRLSDD